MPAQRGWSSPAERELAFATQAGIYLRGFHPEAARVRLLGGERSAMQLGRVSQEQRVWSAIMLRPGKDGASLLQACKAAALIRGFAEAKGLSEEQIWPLSHAAAAFLILEEHRRATEAARGSRGGATAGNNLRRALRHMVKNLGFPIELEGPLVEGAVPKVVASQRAKAAATNPVHLYSMGHGRHARKLITTSNRDLELDRVNPINAVATQTYLARVKG